MFDLKVLVPEYEVETAVLFLKRHYEGGYTCRELLLVEALPDGEALGGLAHQVRLPRFQPRQARRRCDDASAREGDSMRASTFDYSDCAENAPRPSAARCASKRGRGAELPKSRTGFAAPQERLFVLWRDHGQEVDSAGTSGYAE